MTAPSPTPETIEAAASRWFARKRSGEMTPAEAAELDAWLAADPEHRALYDQAEYWWGAANALRGDPEMLKLREEVARTRPPVRRYWAGGAIAASLMAAVFGGWQAMDAGLIPTPAAMISGEQTFRTGVGQTATVRLRDGSVVTLDTDTVLRARQTDERRSIRLSRGQAYFKVAKDKARPFTVAAGDKVVTAVGTAFSVRVQKKAVEVTLVEGKVRVEEAARPAVAPKPGQIAPTEMTPGSRLVAVEDKGWVLKPVDTDKATSWLEGQLIFENRPLGEVAAELNRYSDRKIVIADASVAGTPITGAFTTGDVEAFVSAVRSYQLATVTSENRREVELGAAE
ncbi:MAG TPA: FecR domain-containing protein [Caulobacteraceae bacterium]|nr:FecR domain-containing protein [Caulobacteraceae bacterium]